jgi:L-lysine exporter family protein LysE/ArgO
VLFYLQGLMLGFAMIIPIGPQNAFVMMQGIRRQYYLMTSFICAVSDVALLAVGIFGGSLLLSQSPLLLKLISWGGVAFLLWYGWGAFQSARRIRSTDGLVEMPNYSRWQIVVAILAVTWLNPHVYIDTVVILGSVGSQFLGLERILFALGAMSASFIWFFSLSILAARFAGWLSRPAAQKAINILVGVIMWFIAGQLALSTIN